MLPILMVVCLSLAGLGVFVGGATDNSNTGIVSNESEQGPLKGFLTAFNSLNGPSSHKLGSKEETFNHGSSFDYQSFSSTKREDILNRLHNLEQGALAYDGNYIASSDGFSNAYGNSNDIEEEFYFSENNNEYASEGELRKCKCQVRKCCKCKPVSKASDSSEITPDNRKSNLTERKNAYTGQHGQVSKRIYKNDDGVVVVEYRGPRATVRYFYEEGKIPQYQKTTDWI